MRLRAVGACRSRRAERLRGARRRMSLGLEADPEAPGAFAATLGRPGPPWWASDRRSEVSQSGGAEVAVEFAQVVACREQVPLTSGVVEPSE